MFKNKPYSINRREEGLDLKLFNNCMKVIELMYVESMRIKKRLAYRR